MSQRLLGAVLLLVACTACTPTRILLAPSADELVVGNGRPAQRLRVPEGVPGGLDIEVSSPGAVRRKKDPKAVTVVVNVSVENRSESKLAGVRLGMVRLTDRDGREIPLIDPKVDDPARSTVSLVQPGERREFTLGFSTQRTDDPRDVAPCRLHLPLEYDDRSYPAQVELVRDLPPRSYYAPYWGAAGPYWPYGYYGPYYGPPYYGPGFYGPYGSAGMGWGFRF